MTQPLYSIDSVIFGADDEAAQPNLPLTNGPATMRKPDPRPPLKDRTFGERIAAGAEARVREIGGAVGQLGATALDTTANMFGGSDTTRDIRANMAGRLDDISKSVAEAEADPVAQYGTVVPDVAAAFAAPQSTLTRLGPALAAGVGWGATTHPGGVVERTVHGVTEAAGAGFGQQVGKFFTKAGNIARNAFGENAEAKALSDRLRAEGLPHTVGDILPTNAVRAGEDSAANTFLGEARIRQAERDALEKFLFPRNGAAQPTAQFHAALKEAAKVSSAENNRLWGEVTALGKNAPPIAPTQSLAELSDHVSTNITSLQGIPDKEFAAKLYAMMGYGDLAEKLLRKTDVLHGRTGQSYNTTLSNFLAKSQHQATNGMPAAEYREMMVKIGRQLGQLKNSTTDAGKQAAAALKKTYGALYKDLDSYGQANAGTVADDFLGALKGASDFHKMYEVPNPATELRHEIVGGDYDYTPREALLKFVTSNRGDVRDPTVEYVKRFAPHMAKYVEAPATIDRAALLTAGGTPAAKNTATGVWRLAQNVLSGPARSLRHSNTGTDFYLAPATPQKAAFGPLTRAAQLAQKGVTANEGEEWQTAGDRGVLQRYPKIR